MSFCKVVNVGCSPIPDQSVKPSGSDGFKLLIYDKDTEGRQLGEIRSGKNNPATFWRTNRIQNPDLCLEGTAKLIFIDEIRMEGLPTGLKEVL